jgi:hypothetical protein
MSESTVVVFGEQPPVRLDRLAGRAQVVVCDEKTLPDALPSADVLLVWDFTSDAVTAPGRVGSTPPAPGWTGC